MAETGVDQPLTPAGRLFLQPKMDQVINVAISLESPIDVDAFKSEVRSSIMIKQPRFCSLLVKDSSGREHWRATQVDVDRHVIVRSHPLSDDPSISDEDAVSDFVADLSVSSPLPTDKPLWEFHLLLAHRTAVFRVHHALGDGISLMSMLLSCCRSSADDAPTVGGGGDSGSPRRRWSVWDLLKMVWFTLIYCLEFSLRALWFGDKTTALSGGDGVELWPRRLASARFRLEDMKMVKRVVPGATINDVLFGIISCGLSRYLDIRSPKAIPEGLRMTGVAMVNLRPQAGLQDMSKMIDSKSSGIGWGNKFGMILLPIYYHRGHSDPIGFVKRAKAMIDKKKLSLEAPFSYKVGDLLMSLFGAKVACILNYRVVCKSTFTISNVIGPQKEIVLAGNLVKNIRVTSSSLPHAITMHMVSYAGMADLQILAAKEIIPDPKVLARCFEDALNEMKTIAAEASTKS